MMQNIITNYAMWRITGTLYSLAKNFILITFNQGYSNIYSADMIIDTRPGRNEYQLLNDYRLSDSVLVHY